MKMKKTKLKSRKSVTRRVKVTGRGKILRGRSFSRHLKAGKSQRRIRRLKKPIQVQGSFEKKLRKVLGI